MASRRRIFSARNDVMNFPSEVARGAMVARQMYWKKKEGKLIWPLTYRNEVAGGLESNPAPENLKGSPSSKHPHQQEQRRRHRCTSGYIVGKHRP
jgi:hypothetical protein